MIAKEIYYLVILLMKSQATNTEKNRLAGKHRLIQISDAY